MEEILASIRRIIADDGGDASRDRGAAHDHPAPPSDTDDDVLDLAEIPEAHLDTHAHPQAEPVDIMFQDSPSVGTSHPVPAEAAPPEPPARAPMTSAVQEPAGLPPDDPLVSSRTTASVGHAFNILSHTILSQNARTLEDLVKDMLKPMLKVWLDDNLPPLVERLVRAEIERVARGNR